MALYSSKFSDSFFASVCYVLHNSLDMQVVVKKPPNNNTAFRCIETNLTLISREGNWNCSLLVVKNLNSEGSSDMERTSSI